MSTEWTNKTITVYMQLYTHSYLISLIDSCTCSVVATKSPGSFGGEAIGLKVKLLATLVYPSDVGNPMLWVFRGRILVVLFNAPVAFVAMNLFPSPR
jgi:hypothetical protein